MEPALKLDRLAQLRAELEAGMAQADLLERERLSEDGFREACTFWDAKLAEEAAQKRSVLGTRYNTALNTRRRLLAAKRKKVEPEPADEPAPAAPAPAMGFQRPVASYEPLPYEPPPPVPRPPAPLPAPPASDYGATMVGDERALQDMAAAMPFLTAARAAAGLPIPAPEPPPSSKPTPAVDGGATLTLDDSGLSQADIPAFLKVAREAHAAGAPPPWAPAQAAPIPPPTRDYGSTASIDPNSAELAAALPFLNALREQRPKPAGPTPAASAPPAPAPLAAVAPASRRFSLEQFAALTAQIAAAPDTIAGIRQRWGLTEASHRAESEAWQSDCSSNPPLLARYASLVKHFRAAYAAGARLK